MQAPASPALYGFEFPPCRLCANPCCLSSVISELSVPLLKNPLPNAGRRNPQLVTCLSEVSAFLTACPAVSGDAYADMLGTIVPPDNEASPTLETYHSLQVSRFKLSGRGQWDPSPFLSDELVLYGPYGIKDIFVRPDPSLRLCTCLDS